MLSAFRLLVCTAYPAATNLMAVSGPDVHGPPVGWTSASPIVGVNCTALTYEPMSEESPLYGTPRPIRSSAAALGWALTMLRVVADPLEAAPRKDVCNRLRRPTVFKATPKRVSGLLLAGMLACGGCHAKSPPSPVAAPLVPQVTTAEGRLCIQNCQVIEAVCLGGANQGQINAVGSTPGGILLAILANGAAEQRGREACAANLAQCYQGCSDASITAEQNMRAEMRAAACGPRCEDGSSAIWTGFAAAVGAQGFVRTVVSMCFDSRGNVLRGAWSCTPGTVSCLAGGGKLEGRLTGLDLNTSGPVEGQQNVFGNFSGRLSAAGLQGAYVLRASTGEKATGLWSVERCP